MNKFKWKWIESKVKKEGININDDLFNERRKTNGSSQRVGNKVEMTQGKMWSRSYRNTCTNKNNFAHKNKSLFSWIRGNLYLIWKALKKPPLNFKSLRIIHIEPEYGSVIGFWRKIQNSNGDGTSGCLIFFYTNSEGNKKAMFISLEYLFLQQTKSINFRRQKKILLFLSHIRLNPGKF